jgi:hypothetical protein
MAEATKTAAAVALGQARIAGRIDGTRTKSTTAGRLFFTLFKLPAPDQYASPQTIEVRSSERLGAVGDEVSVIVSVGGYPRSYDAKGDHGEKEPVRTAENTLQFVSFA